MIVNRLAANADPAGTAAETGNGRVNLNRALTDTATASIKPAATPGGGPLVGPYVIAAPSDINTATHQGQQKVSGVTTTYTSGNVTEYFEGDSINFRFNLSSTSTSTRAGVLEVRYSVEDASCDFFDGSFVLGTWDGSAAPIVVVSGTAVWTVSLDGPATLDGTEWVQRLDISKTAGSGGEITVNYYLTVEDDIGTCSGSSQHSRLNAPADGGDVLSAGAKNVPVPGGQIVKFPDIVVTKFIDRNADGDYTDPGELATAGEYEFTLDGTTTLATDANGQVVFASVTPDGDHTVTEQQIDFTAGTYAFSTGSGTNCTFVGSTATANVAAGSSGNVQDANCDFFNVLQDGTIEVIKVLDPTDDPGLFNLQIDGVTEEADASHNGTTGDVTVGVGNHSVGETAGTGTDLGDYTATTSCTATGGAPFDTDGTVTVGAGEAWVCTITNTRNTGSIEVVKDFVGTAGLVDLLVDASTEVSDVGDGGTTGAVTVNTGDHSASEAAGTGTDLGDYNSTYSCLEDSNGASPINGSGTTTASIPVEDGDAWTCTFTNTRKTGSIEVVKELVPSDDTGQFNLQIDGVTAVTDVGDGGTTGEVTVDTGLHNVGETAGTDTVLADYESSIECRDLDGAGAVIASGADAGPLNVTVNEDDGIVCTITNFNPNPAIAEAADILLDKVGVLDDTVVAPDGIANPGDVINYSFTITNTGNVTLTNVDLTDAGLTTISAITDVAGDGVAVLAPGDVETATGTYLITQADIDAGVYDNTATSTGDCPDGTVDCASDDDPHSEPIAEAADILLDKVGVLDDTVVAPDGIANPGDVINYSFTITNTGNVTLTNVDLTDAGLTTISAITDVAGDGVAVLAPGDVETATGTYLITQADIDAGVYDNTATSTGDCPDGTVDCASDDDPHSEPIAEAADILLDKVGVLDDTVVAPDGIANPGDVINYSFTITNTGNVTLTNVDLTDAGLTTISAITDVAGDGVAVLAPGDVETATGTYLITQADIDAGVYDNTATSTGDCPDGTVDCASDDDPHSEPIAEAADILLDKVGVLDDTVVAPDGIANPGDVINYSFTITNTGNVTLTNVDLTDAGLTTISAITDVAGDGVAVLAPGDVETATGTYLITQADIDAGVYDNTATSTGDCPDGTVDCASDDDPHSEPIAEAADILLDKVGVLDDTVVAPDGIANPGDVINYSFTITNTGNVTLTNVDLTDAGLTTISAITDVAGDGVAVLAPGDVETATGTYLITQADIDAGVYDNTATSTGDCPDGTVDCASDDDPHSEPIAEAADILLDKVGVLDDTVVAPDGIANPGDVINYSFTITNTGNVTLTNVDLTDAGLTTISAITDVAGDGVAVLAPGDVETATGTYLITQADIDAGVYDNTATSTGDCPDGTVDCASDDDPHSEPIAEAADILLDKVGVLDDTVVAPDGIANPGDVINYSFTITNTGNVTLTNVDLTDAGLTTISAITDVAGDGVAVLAPGDVETATGTYLITQADIDAGVYDNTATSTGDCPDGTVDCASDDDPHSEDLPQNPLISIVKAFAVDPSVVAGGAGSFVHARRRPTTGNVTLSDALVEDTGVLAADSGRIGVRHESPGDRRCRVGRRRRRRRPDSRVAHHHLGSWTVRNHHRELHGRLLCPRGGWCRRHSRCGRCQHRVQRRQHGDGQS